MTACSSPPPKGTRSKLCFELSTGSKGAGTISVKGTSGVELARGVAHYFRTRCNSSFAWPRTGGNQITLPVNKTTGETSFPAVDGIETRQVNHLSVRACVRVGVLPIAHPAYQLEPRQCLCTLHQWLLSSAGR